MCGGYGVLEMLAMDYEGKQQQLELGAIPLLVQHLQLMPHHPRYPAPRAAMRCHASKHAQQTRNPKWTANPESCVKWCAAPTQRHSSLKPTA